MHTPSWCSFLTITRVADNQSVALDGNLQEVYVYSQGSPSERFYSATLLTGQSYLITISPPFGQTSFSSPWLTVSYRDNDPGCSSGLTLLFPPTSAGAWVVPNAQNTYPR